MAQSRGIRIHQYLDDWLIRAPTKESYHQGTQSLLSLCQELGCVVNLQRSELEPKQVFEFVGYQYDLSHGLVKLTQNRWESILQKVQSIMAMPRMSSQELHVPNRPAYSNRKTGAPGQTLHETHSVAPQKTLEGARISGKGNCSSKVPSPTPCMMDQGNKCLTRPTSAPATSCHSNLYRRLKRRLGCSLRRLHSKRHLVSSRKSSSYKLPGTKSCLAGLEEIPAPSTRKGGASGHRQHYSCGIHQQGGRYEVRLTLCPSMAAPVLVQPEADCSKGQTYPGSPECDCRQVVSTRPNHSDRMVSTSASFQPPDSYLALSPSGHVCNNFKLAQYVSPVPDPNAWAVDALTVSWESLDMYAFPPVSLLSQVISKLADHLYRRVILIAPGWPNMPWFWDLVELSSQIPLCLPHHPDLVTQPFNKARHRDLTNLNLHAWLLEPRQSKSKDFLVQWLME